jgi:signal transduction histidine kinase/DNA-binding response OmpR family regulator/HPt (histidine-containing phosphotransfer) domain-containing protein
LNTALLYSIAAVVLGVLSIVVLQRAKRAERDKLLARQEVSERERSEVALKAALLRSEAAEAQVRRGRHLLDTVANMARIGGWELDLATMMPIWSDEAYRIHEVDPAHRPTFPETMSFYPGEARVHVETAIREALEKGTPYDLTVPFVTKSFRKLWVRVMGAAELKGGVVTRLSGALQDVTQQHEAEEARIAAKDAEAAAIRAKANFLANMSHEIRTPMNGVIGMTELLLDTPLQSSQREFAETIRTSATSLLGVINDILDFSKIEAGKLEVDRVQMHVRDCVEDIAMEMAVPAAARNLELIVNVDPGVPDRVLGDPQRLRQVLTNLIGNAVKFTPKGEIAVEVFPLALQNGRALLSFEVRDTGIGMPPETISQLFEPFVQADDSSTRNYGGMGLGLAIVRRLVTLMGGRIEVSSRPGGGSAFTFSLPFDAVYDAADIASSSRVSTRGRRVLVMDDNPTNRRVLCGQLQPVGFDVTATATGAETLKTLKDAQATGAPFDVLIADDQMPDCDGVSFAAQVKASPKVSGTPLILLTSMDRHGGVSNLERAGFAAYLTKPVRGSELRACIERVLERQLEAVTGRDQKLVTRTSLASDQGQGQFHGRVLVVEDNVVNQQVARRFLQRLGCDVVVAENGKRGVEEFFLAQDGLAQDGKEHYGLVLMDVQMPVMDGLAAAREIRRRETGGQRVPIVALTASAMTDELERCTAAGMDALMVKPLELPRLCELLDRHGFRPAAEVSSGADGSAARAPAAAATPLTPVPKPVDLDQLRTLVGDDREFMSELCETFVTSSTRIVEELARALSAGDRASLSAMAHKLKGGSSSICAHELAKLAATLEKDAKEKPLPELEHSVITLRRAFDAAAGYVTAAIAA